MAIDAASGLFEQILLFLQDARDTEERKYRATEQELVARVAAAFPRFTSRFELEQVLKLQPEEGRTDLHGAFLHMPLLRHEDLWLPILTCRYHHARNAASLQLALFANPAELRALGLRFESPEAWWNEADATDGDRSPGDHDYHHVQLTRHLRTASGNEAEIPLPAEWLPTSYPALPVDASRVPQLLLALVVATYGLRYVERLLKASFSQLVKEELRSMHVSATIFP